MVARSSAQRSVTKVSLIERPRISSPGPTAIPLVAPPRPVDHASAIQSPPAQDWLQRQPRSVVEPAAGDGWKVDALQGMLDVCRPHAKRIERERNARPPAQRLRHQGNRARDLADASDEDQLCCERNPGRRDRKQLVGNKEM